MTIGFRFAERMQGSFRLYPPADERQRHFEFTIECRAPSLRRYAWNGHTNIHGMVIAEGLVEGSAPLTGTLTMRPFGRTLRYTFSFPGTEGTLRFEGEKRVRWDQPIRSLTVLPGAIYNADQREIGSCDVEFDWRRQIIPFVRSFRAVRE